MATNPVITAKQAREITRGRAPHVPIEYETAVKSLQACCTLNEAKYWSDKADALAAWAKIYRSDEAQINAKRLRLHAYRRMGELARELRPWSKGAVKGKIGAKPGPVKLLVQHGLPVEQANAATYIAKMPQKRFDEAVNSPRASAPSTMRPRFTSQPSKSYELLSGAKGGNCLSGFFLFCRKNNAAELAKGLQASEVDKVREWLTATSDWLDELDTRLPK